MAIFDFIKNLFKDDSEELLLIEIEKNQKLSSTNLRYKKELEELRKENPSISKVNSENKELKANLDLKEEVLKELVAAIDTYEDEEKKGLCDDTWYKMLVYEDKYKKKDIVYAGRPIGNKLNNSPIDVKIWAMAGQNDFELKQFVYDNWSTLEQVREDMGDKASMHEVYDECVRRILSITPVKYAFDKDSLGVPEYWAFSYETFKLDKKDCEDYAILRYVLCRIAGVPPELLRICAGNTSQGGHCTFYYYTSECEGFKHFNSTTTFEEDDTLVEMSRNYKDNDTLAIQNVWFSFNEKFSWQFLTTDAKRSWEDQEVFKKNIK